MNKATHFGFGAFLRYIVGLGTISSACKHLARQLTRPAAGCMAVCLCTIPVAAQQVQADGLGRPDCKISSVVPAPSGAVDWKGACTNGYAEGPGELSWRSKDGKTNRLEATLRRGSIEGEAALALGSGGFYTGTFKDGFPDGKGTFLDRDGQMYEGEVRLGERTGTAVGVSPVGDRYEGQWRNGYYEGQGHIKYALGGEYVGQWHAGKRQGHGVLTYAGSGRRFEGEFVDGRIAGTAPAPRSDRTYEVEVDTANGAYFPREVARGIPVPPNVGYAELTPEEKRIVQSYYPALEEGDEPPYPLEGPTEFFKIMSRVAGALRLRGDVMIYANVSPDGKVSTIGLGGLDTPDLRRYAAAAVASLRYKPALCRGQPCAMRFPFRMHLDLER
jgi:hypothetical protein